MCSPIEIFIETRIPFCVIIEILHFCPLPFGTRPSTGLSAGTGARYRNAICAQRAFRLRRRLGRRSPYTNSAKVHSARQDAVRFNEPNA